jgi:RNA polymerase sigma-70 factor (ECF subfamily)
MTESVRLDIAPILQRIAAGDRQAYAGIVAHYQRPLFAFLGRMGLARGRVEELAQDTFLRAWQHLPEYRPERAQFSTWLYTIAHRLALNELARAGHRAERTLDPQAEMGEPDGAETPCGADGPEAALARRRLQIQVQQALCRLSTEDRSVLALAYVHELDLAQIAVIEHSNAVAIKTRLHRARQRLRAQLSPLLEQPHD